MEFWGTGVRDSSSLFVFTAKILLLLLSGK